MNQDKPKTSKYRKTIYRIGIGVFSVYTIVVLLLMYFERGMVFPVPPLTRGNWQAEQFGAQEHYVENTDKTKIHVWTMAKPGAKKTILFCHGNAETLGILSRQLVEMRDRWNVNVVAFDFRGYGKTGGIPNERDILSDSVKVGQWALDLKQFQGTKLIVIGRSLGGAAAVEIATNVKVDGLILDRTFSATVDVAGSRYPIIPVRWVMRNQFRSASKIPKYTGPLYQVHGVVDEVIPYRFGKRLHEACPSKNKEFLTIQGLRHNDPWPIEFWNGAKKFIENL